VIAPRVLKANHASLSNSRHCDFALLSSQRSTGV